MLQKLLEITAKPKRIACGLMSGTSLDGVDAAVVEITDSGPKTRVKLLRFLTLPYTEEEKEQILKLCTPETSSVDKICRMNVFLGEKMAEAAISAIRLGGFSLREIDFISSHGQTIYHIPNDHATMQIGELAVIAERTGCITVGDFRPSDMAAGGQGAPLVPFTDYLLFHDDQKGRVLLNIGGISNVTVIRAGAEPKDVIAFDTGPGNMLIDALVRIGTDGQKDYDEDGRFGARGSINREWLRRILQRDEYLMLPPPKSTGREYYGDAMALRLWHEGKNQGLSFEDIIATVTEYTAQSIRINLDQFTGETNEIQEVFVGGGGVKNKTLMSSLEKGLNASVKPMEALGFSSDAKEAIAFALLGNEFLCGHPNNIPTATGARRQVSMGKLVFPGMKA